MSTTSSSSQVQSSNNNNNNSTIDSDPSPYCVDCLTEFKLDQPIPDPTKNHKPEISGERFNNTNKCSKCIYRDHIKVRHWLGDKCYLCKKDFSRFQNQVICISCYSKLQKLHNRYGQRNKRKYELIDQYSLPESEQTQPIIHWQLNKSADTVEVLCHHWNPHTYYLPKDQVDPGICNVCLPEHYNRRKHCLDIDCCCYRKKLILRYPPEQPQIIKPETKVELSTDGKEGGNHSNPIDIRE